MKLAWGWCSVLVLAACGGSDAAPDATVPDAEVAPPCHTTANLATADVVEIGLAEDPPTPTGGSITDGTYVLTASVFYTGAGGMAGETGVVYRATSVNTAGDYEYIDEGTDPPTITTGVYQTSGVDDITIAQNCPNLAPLPFDKVSATATEYTIFQTDATAGVTQALTFTMP